MRHFRLTGKALAGAFFLTSLAAGVEAEEFFYKHQSGDKFRAIATNIEEVYVNGVLDHRSEVLNRNTSEVTRVENGVATIEAVYQVADHREGEQAEVYQWSEEYRSVYGQDRLGKQTVDAKYFQPSVRDVPLFPGRDLSPGDKWIKEGAEVYDLRNFGVRQPLSVPFKADYQFLGLRVFKEREYPAFSVSYQINKRLSAPIEAAPGQLLSKDQDRYKGSGQSYVTRISGSSTELVYWDAELGQPAASEGEFTVKFEFSDKTTIEYRASSHGELVEAENMNRQELADEIADEIERLGINDAEVKVVGEGVTISLENIQFTADSAELRASEKAKIDKIAEILRKYGDRDILVSGHTARAGTVAEQQSLSEERAAAVAGYLIERRVRGADRVMTRGFGAERPIADNRSEEGKRKNRRVEITILEN